MTAPRDRPKSRCLEFHAARAPENFGVAIILRSTASPQAAGHRGTVYFFAADGGDWTRTQR